MVDWDLLDNPWDSITGWAKTGSGTYLIEPAGYLHMTQFPVGTLIVWKDIGSLPSQFTAEFKLKVDNYGSNGNARKTFHDGVHRVEFMIRPTQISLLNYGGTWDNKAIINTVGIEYVWRLLVDTAEDSVKVYRNEIFIHEFTSINHFAFPDGYVLNTLVSLAETHDDYFKIATGLHTPVDTYTRTYGVSVRFCLYLPRLTGNLTEKGITGVLRET